MLMLAAAAPTRAGGQITLAGWSTFSPDDRRLAIVAAIEGVILASSGPQGSLLGVDAGCLASKSIDGIDQQLLSSAREEPLTPLAVAILETSKCHSR